MDAVSLRTARAAEGEKFLQLKYEETDKYTSEGELQDVATVLKDVYHEQTKPLIDYYEQRGLLRRFDGSRTPSEVHDHIRATLATLRLEEEL